MSTTTAPPATDRRRRRGVRVALIGPDGAGKTTIAAALAERVPGTGAAIYMGLHQGDPRPATGGARRLAGDVLRRWRGWRAGQRRWRRGELVVFDRYATDALLPLPPGAPRRRRIRRAVLARACPRPDLLVLLDAPVPVLAARRARAPAVEGNEAVARDRAVYLELARRIDAEVVDAGEPADVVADRVLDLVASWDGRRG